MELFNVWRKDFFPHTDSDYEESVENVKDNGISLTSNFLLYSNYCFYIFKQDGTNKGWLSSEKIAQSFIVEYAIKLEKEYKTDNKVITRETSDDGNIIKIFSKIIGSWYDSSPELISTLEIEKIAQID